MADLVILGAGGHGRVAAEIAEMTGYERIRFLDPSWPARQATGPWPIVGNDTMLEDFRSLGASDVFVAVGDNRLRASLIGAIGRSDRQLARLVHPFASVSRHAVLDAGCLVAAGAVISCFARIEAGVIVNTGASVDHDCDLGTCVHIGPGARVAADVSVGALSFIGAAAGVRNGVRIGRDVTVGVGAAVVADIPDGTVVVGCPARPIRGSASRGPG